MRDILNSVEAVVAALILLVATHGLVKQHQIQMSKRLDVPTWPPNDTKPATADASP